MQGGFGGKLGRRLPGPRLNCVTESFSLRESEMPRICCGLTWKAEIEVMGQEGAARAVSTEVHFSGREAIPESSCRHRGMLNTCARKPADGIVLVPGEHPSTMR
jgi:hypothetical protein